MCCQFVGDFAAGRCGYRLRAQAVQSAFKLVQFTAERGPSLSLRRKRIRRRIPGWADFPVSDLCTLMSPPTREAPLPRYYSSPHARAQRRHRPPTHHASLSGVPAPFPFSHRRGLVPLGSLGGTPEMATICSWTSVRRRVCSGHVPDLRSSGSARFPCLRCVGGD